MINLNSSENWANDDDWEGTDTIVPRHETMKIVNVTQLEKDAILVCYDSMIHLILFFSSNTCKVNVCYVSLL